MSTHAHKAGEPSEPDGRNWTRHKDGLFHCPHCEFTHQRAASVGRHAVTHSNKPYARNTAKDVKKHAGKSRTERKRDYAREYYLRNQAEIRAKQNSRSKQRYHAAKTNKETKHVNGANSCDPHEITGFETTTYFLAGSWAKDIQSAARSLGCSEGELATRILQILRATTLR